MAKRLIEVFTAGCSVCEGAVEQVKALACDNCEVVVYNLNEKCDTLECNGQVIGKNAGMIKMHGSEGKMEEHFFSLSVNNKLTVANGGGGNVHVQVI
ncbi:hypothetical protein ABN702_12780 [Bacillus haimaensis]|uniref:hypothetical protein n=1 Tax=Bacillus haimaensis TaxID=3160967 RepID=UPI003AA94CC0